MVERAGQDADGIVHQEDQSREPTMIFGSIFKVENRAEDRHLTGTKKENGLVGQKNRKEKKKRFSEKRLSDFPVDKEENTARFFVLPVPKIENGPGFFVLQIRNLEELPSSNNAFPHLRKSRSPSSPRSTIFGAKIE